MARSTRKTTSTGAALAFSLALALSAIGATDTRRALVAAAIDPELHFVPAGDFERAAVVEVETDPAGDGLFVGTPAGLHELAWRRGSAHGERGDTRFVPVVAPATATWVWRPIFDRRVVGRAFALSRLRFGEILTSDDSGATWTVAGKVPLLLDRLYSSPSIDDVIYARGYLGDDLWRSPDAGHTWAKIADRFIGALAVAAGPAGDVLYSSTTAWIARSEDGGASWVGVSRGGVPFGGVDALSVAPSNPSTLYGLPSEFFPACLSRSEDRGDHWTDLSGPALLDGPTAVCGALAIDPRDERHLWILGGLPLVEGSPGGPWRAYESTDGGATWSEGGALVSAVLLAVEERGGELELLAYGHRGLSRSTDGGRSWRGDEVGITAEAGLLVAASNPVSPGASSVVYVSSSPSGSIHRSADGAATWERRGRLGNLQELAVDAVDPDALRALRASPLSAVWTSADGGERWRRNFHFVGGEIFRFLYDLAVDPLAAGGILVGTSKDAYLSRDGGRSYVNLTRSLPSGLECHISGSCYPIRGIQAGAFDPVVPGRLFVQGDSGFFRQERPGEAFQPTLFAPAQDLLDPRIAHRFYRLGRGYDSPTGRAQIVSSDVRRTELGHNVLPAKFASPGLRLAGFDPEGRLLVLDEDWRRVPPEAAVRLLLRDLDGTWARFSAVGLPGTQVARLLAVAGPGGGLRFLAVLHNGGLWRADLRAQGVESVSPSSPAASATPRSPGE